LDRCNTSQDTIATTLSTYGRTSYTPEALVAYLNSKLGERLLWRQFQGNVQLHLSLDDGRKVPVPRLVQTLQNAITRAYEKASELRQEAIANSDAAEQTLLRALGLEGWQPPEPLSYTRSSRDAFTTGRLDAEFFAPRVADLLRHLNKDGRTLGDVAPARHERFDPGKPLPPSLSSPNAAERSHGAWLPVPPPTGEDRWGRFNKDAASFLDRPHPNLPPLGEGTGVNAEFDYIEIGGVRSDGTAEAEKTPYAEAPSRATWVVRSGDVLTSMVRPIRRLSALVTPDQDGFVCSSGFVVLEPRNVAAEVLLTYLRLPPVCELMDLHTSASLYPAISENDLLALPFPGIAEPVQAEIVASVRAAHQAKRRAQALLEAAKRAVEIAIEDSEAAALVWLEQAGIKEEMEG
jgi:hypothetical protein